MLTLAKGGGWRVLSKELSSSGNNVNILFYNQCIYLKTYQQIVVCTSPNFTTICILLLYDDVREEVNCKRIPLSSEINENSSFNSRMSISPLYSAIIDKNQRVYWLVKTFKYIQNYAKILFKNPLYLWFPTKEMLAIRAHS